MIKIIVIALFVTAVSSADMLQCYQCSSINNTKCADPFTAEETLQDCPFAPEHIDNTTKNHFHEAQLCRKLKQSIDGQIRITRSCGYINDETRDGKSCFKDAFSAFTSTYYCACTGGGCNRSRKIISPDLILMLSVLFLVIENLIGA